MFMHSKFLGERRFRFVIFCPSLFLFACPSPGPLQQNNRKNSYPVTPISTLADQNINMYLSKSPMGSDDFSARSL